MRVKHILLPTDFSEHSEAAVDYVKDIAQRHDSKITLMYVVDEGQKVQGWYVPHISLDEFYKDQEENAKKRLEKCCYESLRDFKDVEKVVARGVPAERIVDYAEKNGVDLIVMGSLSKSGMDFFFGSTVAKVLKKAKIPVLCVKQRPS